MGSLLQEISLEEPEATGGSLLAEYSEGDLAAHQSAINRALGLRSVVERGERGPAILIEEEPDTPARPELSSPTESNRLEFIDLTDSPPASPPVSPTASQSRSPSQPSAPASPALQCPVCLDTFSALRSQGDLC